MSKKATGKLLRVRKTGLVKLASRTPAVLLDRLSEMEQRLAQLEGRTDPEPSDIETFQPRALSDARAATAGVIERRKWAAYYSLHGCVSCKQKRKPHSGNGFCPTCRAGIQRRLQVIRQELEEEYQRNRAVGL